jgi:hypothetical protein
MSPHLWIVSKLSNWNGTFKGSNGHVKNLRMAPDNRGLLFMDDGDTTSWAINGKAQFMPGAKGAYYIAGCSAAGVTVLAYDDNKDLFTVKYEVDSSDPNFFAFNYAKINADGSPAPATENFKRQK